jgi:hypothetical protein
MFLGGNSHIPARYLTIREASALQSLSEKCTLTTLKTISSSYRTWPKLRETGSRNRQQIPFKSSVSSLPNLKGRAREPRLSDPYQGHSSLSSTAWGDVQIAQIAMHTRKSYSEPIMK